MAIDAAHATALKTRTLYIRRTVFRSLVPCWLPLLFLPENLDSEDMFGQPLHGLSPDSGRLPSCSMGGFPKEKVEFFFDDVHSWFAPESAKLRFYILEVQIPKRWAKVARRRHGRCGLNACNFFFQKASAW